jgi:NAD(P)-dependent dehydrogenase (short-subunit alcohol dehydrogenase family)
MGPVGSLFDCAIEDWRKVIDTNLTGAYIMSRSFARRVVGDAGGRIVNVTSSLGHRPKPPWGAYSVSKAGLEALTTVLAKELKPTGIVVNMVDPGSVRTRMRTEALRGEDDLKAADPARVAPLFVYLASEECRESGELLEAWNWQCKA